MYSSSTHYKDACEIGKLEYAAAYRTLIWMVKAKQKNINWGEQLIEAGYKELVLIGAGDICDILLCELQTSGVQIAGIIESNINKYSLKYADGLLKIFEEISLDFFKGKKFIVNYMNRYDEWVSRLQNKGVEIDNIVSVEELISYLVCLE